MLNSEFEKIIKDNGYENLEMIFNGMFKKIYTANKITDGKKVKVQIKITNDKLEISETINENSERFYKVKRIKLD